MLNTTRILLPLIVTALSLWGTTASYRDGPEQGDSFAVARQGVLYAGGRRHGDATTGQSFFFYQIPPDWQKTNRLPIVFIHGSRQTGAGFMGTPDGREGWMSWFVRRGWPVYVMDQAGRGKAGYWPDAYGPQEPNSRRSHVMDRFSAPERLDPAPWADAGRHTQWPGGPGAGVNRQPAFEQFMQSQVANMADVDMQYTLSLRAVVELLELIGPAVIVTHSQSGPLSWMIAQASPDKVKAIIAIEPTGNVGSDGSPGTRCGITNVCLDYSPAISGPDDLGLYRVPARDDRHVGCLLQRKAIHRLPKLSGIPVLIATGEASYHAASDYCTSAFLNQTGVSSDYLYLPDVGIRGNGHMQMIEMNNLEIAAQYESWLEAKLAH